MKLPEGPSKSPAGRAGKLVLVIVVLAVGFALGRFFGGVDERRDHDHGAPQAAALAKSVIWTCSMDPQVRQTEPGKCPICGMDLIPLDTGDDDDLGPRMMAMSEAAMKLAEIRTQRVERRFVDMEIPLVGKVEFDESRVKTISAWVPGRLDRLFVDYTGVPVKAGEHLVEMFSPELFATQEELIQNAAAVKNLEKSNSEFVRRTAFETLEAAREKLIFLGLTAEQVVEIEQRKTPSATVEIRAPIGGIVIRKTAREGMYVKTGTPIYTVADLSMVWVLLDAYESDLPWIRYGQEVEIRVVAFGDKVFPGWISFIDPVLDPKTRTVKVRVIVENPAGELRPNMFARALVKSRIGGQERVLTDHLEDRFICPMHPEVVQEEPGDCPQCGMALVSAKELGYSPEEAGEPPLVVPATAVLTTGKRAVVYVRVPDKEQPTFEGVEVELGPRAGEYYLVRSGLEEGQRVVVNGNFKIDSALQLQAKPSMMSPASTPLEPPVLETPGPFREVLASLFGLYLEVQKALANDDPDGAFAASANLLAQLDASGAENLSADAATVWQELGDSLESSARALSETREIQKQREVFQPLSMAMEGAVRRFGPLPGMPIRRFFCPMAFNNKGAHWLQEDEIVFNPYFGDAMLRCGEMTEVLSESGQSEGKVHDHGE